MNDVSLLRLYLLRAMYLLIVVGLGAVIWPEVLHRQQLWERNEGVVACMLAAFSLMALLGLRYPLQMLPVLFWEMAWKLLWLFNEALPRWLNGTIDDSIARTAMDCSLVLLIPLVIPWGYVYQHYLRKPGDRWANCRNATMLDRST
jgi:hypothetical protein